MIKLTLTEKGGEPRALSFDKDEVSIGRVSGNDIVLPKGNVSKRHSKLVVRGSDLEVVDLKSTNGTYVNGRKIAEPTSVSASDKIYVGDFLIILDGDGAVNVDMDSGGGSAGVSASRRLPMPPPPPAARGSAGFAGDRTIGIEGDGPSEVGADDDESLGLAMKPPRSGRMPLPPPPPPPRRSGTHPALGLEDDGVDIGGDLAPPSPSDVSGSEDDLGPTSGPALFEGSRTSDFDDGPGRRVTTGNRVDAAVAEGSFTGPTSTGSGRAVEGGGDFAGRAAERATAEHGIAALNEGLEALLADPGITQILITGPDSVFVERGGKLTKLESSLGDPNTVADVLWRIASTAVPPPPPDNPVVDVRLVDGTRIAALFAPASATGVCASIRKASLPDQSLAALGPAGTMAKETQTVLEAALAGQRNILVTGDAGAITALLGALAAGISSDKRVVAIGGSLGRARAGWTELTPTADLPSLIRVAAALRGDYFLLGETAGPEVLDILLAAARGQDGVIFGMAGRSASEALARVEALATQNLGASGVPQLANSTLDLVVHVVALSDGGARIVEITEVKLDNANHLTTDPVLVWRSEGSRRGGASGKMQIIGVTSRLAATVAASGGSLPSNLIRK